ncbi:MAG TPA: class I SAM-dependent methyltransferase [Ktedonobacteraceae bacterium]
MSTSPEPEDERPDTYFVQDRSTQEEILHLQKQDRWTTASMGGVLAEQPDPEKLRRVLDIGSGTGDWLLDAAGLYAEIMLLIGVDRNSHMVQFAREQAKARKLEGRVEFHVMDVLSQLEFPNGYFDLINVRFAINYLRTVDWPGFLNECRRVCRPGGVVRVTEANITPDTPSAALIRLVKLQHEALYKAGNLFTPEGASLVQTLPRLFERSGFQQVQTCSYSMEARAGTETWQLAFDDLRFLFRTNLPFLQKWTTVPDNYQEIYQQMLKDLQQSDYRSTSLLFTTWGTRPE